MKCYIWNGKHSQLIIEPSEHFLDEFKKARNDLVIFVADGNYGLGEANGNWVH